MTYTFVRPLAALVLVALAAGCATTGPASPASADPAANAATAAVSSAASAPSAAASAATSTTAASTTATTASAATAPAAAASAAAPEATDPLRPDVRVDLDDKLARIDVWVRIRAGFAMPDLDTGLVRAQERWYASRPDYVQRMTERSSRYLFHIVEEIERRGMPTELALLPFIESAFNPQAMSVARASGMWQFIPSTGRVFDLTQNVFRDDRRDVLASTRAALDYLAKLHGMFGDWHLALAAYNWGEGSVQRAIAKNRRAGKPTDYLSLRMPRETANYVPKLQAVKNIVARPEAFSLSLPVIENHPYFLTVPIERDIDVTLAAKLAEIDLDEFRALNPQMNKPVILAAGTPRILLPYDNANTFVRALPAHKGPLASWTAWVAPKTMRPAEAAKQVGMSEDELREVNRIPPRVSIKAGSTLLVPRNGQRLHDVAEHIADNAMIAFAPDAPPARRVAFKAGKKGDSVAAVARRYRVSAAQVAQWNDVSPGASFKPGQTIVVYVAQKARGKAVAKSSSSRASKPAASSRKSKTR